MRDAEIERNLAESRRTQAAWGKLNHHLLTAWEIIEKHKLTASEKLVLITLGYLLDVDNLTRGVTLGETSERLLTSYAATPGEVRNACLIPRLTVERSLTAMYKRGLLTRTTREIGDDAGHTRLEYRIVLALPPTQEELAERERLEEEYRGKCGNHGGRYADEL
jgi:DNA-binding MarR family transcriptional regulator